MTGVRTGNLLAASNFALLVCAISSIMLASCSLDPDMPQGDRILWSLDVDTAAFTGCWRGSYDEWRIPPGWMGADPQYKEVHWIDLLEEEDSTMGLLAARGRRSDDAPNPWGNPSHAGWRGLTADTIQVFFGGSVHQSLVMLLHATQRDTLRGTAEAHTDVILPGDLPRTDVTLARVPCAGVQSE